MISVKKKYLIVFCILAVGFMTVLVGKEISVVSDNSDKAESNVNGTNREDYSDDITKDNSDNKIVIKDTILDETKEEDVSVEIADTARDNIDDMREEPEQSETEIEISSYEENKTESNLVQSGTETQIPQDREERTEEFELPEL